MSDEPTKFCKDCRFKGWGNTFPRCQHRTAVRFGSRYLVNAVMAPREFCDNMRASYGECGPDAKLWEPRR